jgi:hypothetical protein
MSAHRVAVHYFLKPSTGGAQHHARGPACTEGVWQSEFSPEAFLREVVDTLSGFMRDDLGTRAPKTGETPPER